MVIGKKWAKNHLASTVKSAAIVRKNIIAINTIMATTRSSFLVI